LKLQLFVSQYFGSGRTLIIRLSFITSTKYFQSAVVPGWTYKISHLQQYLNVSSHSTQPLKSIIMFGFFILRPLWKELKTPLKGILKDKFSVIGRQFKGTLSSTGNDLIVVLQNNLGAGIYNRYSSGTIKKK